jgi:hypothetical protein
LTDFEDVSDVSLCSHSCRELHQDGLDVRVHDSNQLDSVPRATDLLRDLRRSRELERGRELQ